MRSFMRTPYGWRLLLGCPASARAAVTPGGSGGPPGVGTSRAAALPRQARPASDVQLAAVLGVRAHGGRGAAGLERHRTAVRVQLHRRVGRGTRRADRAVAVHHPLVALRAAS